MKSEDYSDEHLREVLERTGTVAVVGVSTNPVRPSFIVARYLKTRKFDVIPVNPGSAGQILLDAPIRASLSDIPKSDGPVHMVDVFRRSEDAGRIVDEALDTLLDRGLQTIWMQIGVSDRKAAKRARKKGIDVIMNRCPKIEYQRLWGELGWGGFNTGVISSRLR